MVSDSILLETCDFNLVLGKGIKKNELVVIIETDKEVFQSSFFKMSEDEISKVLEIFKSEVN